MTNEVAKVEGSISVSASHFSHSPINTPTFQKNNGENSEIKRKKMRKIRK